MKEKINLDSKDQSLSIQVSCLHFLRVLRRKLLSAGVLLSPLGIRLVGGTAAHLVYPEGEADRPTKHQLLRSVHDLDFCIFIDQPHFRDCLIAVEETVSSLLRQEKIDIDLQQVNDRFFRDSVMVAPLSPTGEVTDGDYWSLICLGSDSDSLIKRIDLKFIYRLNRRYVFSLDSFELLLDPLIEYDHKPAGSAGIEALGPSPKFRISGAHLC